MLSHEDLHEYMTARYFISPSRLYSAVRLLPNNQGYDVPVVGDWVTIGVIGERGPTRVSRAPVTSGRVKDDSDHDEGDPSASVSRPAQRSDNGKGRDGAGDAQSSKPFGRKYVNLKLIDFGARSKGESVNGKAAIRGDALLSLLLFQSDSEERVEDEDGRPRVVYKGGSRGAFERMAKLREGAVVALLNPRILKPFQVRPS